MQFHEYSSIDRCKDLAKLEASPFYDEDAVATEKVHGSNFSFHYDGTHRIASRNGFLSEPWYDRHLQVDYRPIVEELLRLYGGSSIRVYGEIFGGNYRGIESTVPSILKGNDYIPHIDFIVFDVVVDDVLMPFDPDMWNAAGFKTVPVVARGKYGDLLRNIEAEGLTAVSAMYGLENIGRREGLVVRPIAPKFRSDGRRIIYKLISQVFKPNKGLSSTPVVVAEEHQELYDSLDAELTVLRLENVISKEQSVSADDIGRIGGLLIQDLLKDSPDISKKVWRSIKKGLIHKANVMTRQYIMSL